MTDKKVTVAEYARIFAQLVEQGHGDFYVLLEGCDCDGEASDEVETCDGFVYARRVNNVQYEYKQ